MKKYIATAIGGWIACELYSAARAGYFTRAAELVRAGLENDSPFTFRQFYNYVVYGLDPRETIFEAPEHWPEISTDEWVVKIKDARALSGEGFTVEQIAKALGMPEDAVEHMLEIAEDRHFRVTLRAHQFDVVKLALEMLQPEDDGSVEIVQETLQAFLTAEEIEIKDV